MRCQITIVVFLLLAGCESIKIATMQKIQPAGGENDVVSVGLFNKSNQTKIDLNDLSLTSTEQSIVESICFPPPPPEVRTSPDGTKLFVQVAPILMPAIGKLAFDYSARALGEYVGSVKERASKSYSASFFASGFQLAGAKCIAIQRLDEMGKQKALFISSIEEVDTSTFQLKPVLAWAENSIALTKCEDVCYLMDKKKGLISMSMAVAVSGVVPGTNNVSELKQFGAAAVTIPKVPLGGPSKVVSVASAKASDIVPYPTVTGVAKVTVSVTETGNIPGNFTKASEEIKAIKEAMGPVVSAGIAKRYEDD
jgi:hypothetical protein